MRFAIGLAVRLLLLSLYVAPTTFGALAMAQPVASPSAVAAKMRESTERFLATLPERQRALAVRPFDDADRVDWHYTPRRRNGVSFNIYGSEEAAEGREAYKEKRAPDFSRFPRRP